MKILIINYVYFVHGGPSRYLFNLKQKMESKGHIVIPFSINFTKNEPTEYSKYFVSPISGKDRPFFKDFKFNYLTIKKSFERLFYSEEVYNKLSELLINEKPDFALILPYLKKFSPSVLVALNNYKIPFAVRLSDFNNLCANGLFYRDSQTCELCLTGSKLNAVKHKCVKDSYFISLIDYLASQYHRRKGYFDLIDTFIVPTHFFKKKMIESGISPSKIFQINTFVPLHNNKLLKKKKNKIVYIGRLVKEKGIETLLLAVSELNELLNEKNIIVEIVGEGEKAYVEELKRLTIENNITFVHFLGKKNKDEIDILLENAKVSIVPSLWYENMPNSLLESFAAGVPVIATNHGCFPEIVVENYNGLLFEPNSPNQLAKAIKKIILDDEFSFNLGKNAKKYVETYHNPEDHYEKIMDIYKMKMKNM